MNEQEHLLAVLSEECSEVVQEVCKALRFGLHDVNPKEPNQGDNQRRIERELAQLMAVAELLGLRIRNEDKVAKVEKLKKYMGYARKLGTLEDPAAALAAAPAPKAPKPGKQKKAKHEHEWTGVTYLKSTGNIQACVAPYCPEPIKRPDCQCLRKGERCDCWGPCKCAYCVAHPKKESL